MKNLENVNDALVVSQSVRMKENFFSEIGEEGHGNTNI